MSSLSQNQITPAATLASATAVDVSTLPRTKTVFYASYPGNVDAIYLYMSEDGINYGASISLSAGVTAIPDAVKKVKAIGTPTVQGGVTPVIYVNGTFQDGQTSVTATNSVPFPLAIGGSNSGPTGIGSAGSWVASSNTLIGTEIAVAKTGGGTNYWVNVTGLGVTGSTIPAGLSSSSPSAPVSDSGVTWSLITSLIGTVYDGSVVWIGSAPTSWPGAAATVDPGTAIKVLVTGSTYNYWVNEGAQGTTAGSIPAGLSSASPSSTVTDNSVTWTLANTAWATGTTYTAGTSAVNTGSGAYVYGAIQTGISVTSAYGPGAFLDTTNTAIFPNGLTRNYSVEYANGSNSDQLYLYGSPDGKAWFQLEDINFAPCQYTGPGQLRYVSNAAVKYIGAYYNVALTSGATLALQAAEYVLTAAGVQGATINIGTTNANNTINIGSSTSSIGFYGETATPQYSTPWTTFLTFVDSGSTVVHLASTFTGDTGATAYSITDLVRAMKLNGLLHM